MTIEFQYEKHTEKHHLATATLSSEFSYDTIQHMYTCMSENGANFIHLSTKKPKGFHLTAAEVDAFVEAWEQFKDDIALYEAIEADRKNRAEQAEMDRQVAVWKQVEQLAASIPGLEILAREDERWDEDTDTYIPSQAWNVKHVTLGHGNMYLYNADAVLAEVQDTIDVYNSQLEEFENQEKDNWYGWHPIHVEQAKKFLATHRAFIAHKTAPLVEQQA